MAKPDLDDGYFRIAYELMAAVAAAGFNRGAQIMIVEVFSQIYGPAKRKFATLSPSEIAHRTKLDRSNLIRSIRELTKANVLVNVGGVEYRFNKDYETWKLNETPEQRSLRLSYSRMAPTVAKAYAYDAITKDPISHEESSKSPVSDPTQGGCVNSDTGVQSDQQTSCVNSDTLGKDTIPPPYVSPPQRYEGEILLPSAAAAAAERVRDISDTSRETEPEKSSPPLAAPLRSARFPGDTPETRLIAWARDTLGERCEHECFVSALIPFMKSYPLDWVERAILKAVAVNPDGLARYVNGTLAGWWPHGPERSDPHPAVNGTAPHPARKPTPQEREREYVEKMRRAESRIKSLEDEL